MSKRILPKLLLWAAVPIMFFTSCVDDKYLSNPATVPDQSFVEEFDTVSSAYARGWKIMNTSVPLISNLWQQGGDVNPFFNAYSSSGSNVGFIGINAFVSNPAIGVISEWLISPSITMQNGDKITFYTRGWMVPVSATDSSDYGNRLQLRLNTTNDGLNVGSDIEAGDFDVPLLDINPTYLVNSVSVPNPLAFPGGWTRFEATVYGLQQPVRGRFAFKYFIEDGTNYGSGIGIDKVTYKSAGH